MLTVSGFVGTSKYQLIRKYPVNLLILVDRQH